MNFRKIWLKIFLKITKNSFAIVLFLRKTRPMKMLLVNQAPSAFSFHNILQSCKKYENNKEPFLSKKVNWQDRQMDGRTRLILWDLPAGVALKSLCIYQRKKSYFPFLIPKRKYIFWNFINWLFYCMKSLFELIINIFV